MPDPVTMLKQRAQLPPVPSFPSRMVVLPGRGRTLVTDLSGPPGAPTVLLLHAVGCTGLLTWYPAMEALAEHYRVVTFDQRWHGRGIQSGRFSLADCADDAAAVIQTLGLERVIVAGYSMGSIVAQRVWRQHPRLIEGLVLAATTDRFRNTPYEQAFHFGMGVSMGALRAVASSRSVSRAARLSAEAVDLEPSDAQEWALAQWRQTSPWAVAQAVAALGRHHSRPWLGRIDVPTAVVVCQRDRVIPTPQQRAIARRIPASTVHPADIGHAGCVMQAERFVPVLLDAVSLTASRAAAARDARGRDPLG